MNTWARLACEGKIFKSTPSRRLFCPFDDFYQPPALVFAEWAGFHDADGVSLSRIVVFVVCHEFGSLLHILTIHRVFHPALDCNCDAFVHLIADNETYSFLTCCSFFHICVWLGEPLTVPHQLPLSFCVNYAVF